MGLTRRAEVLSPPYLTWAGGPTEDSQTSAPHPSPALQSTLSHCANFFVLAQDESRGHLGRKEGRQGEGRQRGGGKATKASLCRFVGCSQAPKSGKGKGKGGCG